MKGLKIVVLLLSVVLMGSCANRGQLNGRNFGNGYPTKSTMFEYRNGSLSKKGKGCPDALSNRNGTHPLRPRGGRK
jgi:hypothetical protein